MKNAAPTETLRFRLLNEFQKNFPLCPRPFEAIAKTLNSTEDEVLAEYQALSKDGFLSRIGAVIVPNSIGVSTLAAMLVPNDRLGSVAGIVNSFNEVNHNYERTDSDLNLWFVVNATDEQHLKSVLEKIETKTGLSVHDLRLEEEFRIDLGFDLSDQVEFLQQGDR